MVVSDPLITFSIQKDTGKLNFLQDHPLGGVFPRHFSFNANGTLVAVVATSSDRVNIIERDPINGLLGAILATISVPAPNMVIFDDA